MNEKDKFYDHLEFDDERTKQLFEGWDSYRGNRGAVLNICADLLKGKTVLDVGCGVGHLYPLIKDRVTEYVGVDIDPRAIQWAKERYPELKFEVRDAYDLEGLGNFDTVYAIGLYRRINETRGINEMLKHTEKAIVLTYLHRNGSEPDYFPDTLWEFIRGDKIFSIELRANRIIGTDILRINI